MLISHTKRFIFTKTVKTAGTSIESYFEPYCMAPGTWSFSHARREHVCAEGVVGARTRNPLVIHAATWFNHMPAGTIRALVGPAVWDAYFKFTIVRNPYSQMVSAYHAFAGLFGRSGTRENHDRDLLQQDFEAWLSEVPLPLDRNKFVIDGQYCVDYAIRFESLHEGLEEVCRRVGVPLEPQRLRFLKKSTGASLPVQDHYSPRSLQMIREACAFELETFGYGVPWE